MTELTRLLAIGALIVIPTKEDSSAVTWVPFRGTRNPFPFAVLIVLLLAIIVLPASARNQTGFRPELAIETVGGQKTSAFHFHLEPGESETIELRFSVSSDSPVEVVTYVADAISPPNGGLGLGPADEGRLEHTSWIDFDAETLTLNPGNPVESELSVEIPDNAAPGQYVAALAVQTTEPILIPGSEGAGQIVRAVAAIAIIVPGDLEPEFELGEPALVQQLLGASIQVPIANTGNIPVYPQGTLTLESMTGDRAASIPIAMGAVFAGGDTYLDIMLTEPPSPGQYTLVLSLTDPDSGATAQIAGAPLIVPELATSPVEDEPTTLITFAEVTVEPEEDPLASVLVGVKVANVGQPVSGATLTLEVSQDGQIVERVPIAEGVTLVDGVTSFSTSYTPINGFSPGQWTFRVQLESIDTDGVVTLIAQSDIVGDLDVPQ